MILVLDAARADDRAQLVTRALLSRLEDSVETVPLASLSLAPLTPDELTGRARPDRAERVYSLAHQLAGADTVVITSPCQSLVCPASLSLFLEEAAVCGVTYGITAEEHTYGLCRAETVYYVYSSDGPLFGEHPGFQYVSHLFRDLFGVRECVFLSVTLQASSDVDPEDVLHDTYLAIDRYFAARSFREKAPPEQKRE